MSNSCAVQISVGSAYLDSSSWILCFCSSPFLPFSVWQDFTTNSMSKTFTLGLPTHTETFHSSFSIDWWLWLFLTGASIGCVTRFFQLSSCLLLDTDYSQCENDRSFCDCSRRCVYHWRPLGQIWGCKNAYCKFYLWRISQLGIDLTFHHSVNMRHIGVLAYSVLSSCRSLSLWPLLKSTF